MKARDEYIDFFGVRRQEEGSVVVPTFCTTNMELNW